MSKKILVIEDDKFLRELMIKKLANEGFEVSSAADGEEGIRCVKEKQPDLILLDLILPGLDGFGVLTKLQEDPALPKIPVIILSNLSQREEIEKARQLGVKDFLIKAHFVPGEIVSKVNDVLARKM